MAMHCLSHKQSCLSLIFVTDFNFKVCDVLLLLSKKKSLFIYFGLLCFIREAFKVVKAQTQHYNSLARSPSLYLTR